MTHSSSPRRRARGGRGLLPPNPKQWENEHNGLDLREDLGLPLDAPLPHMAAFELLPGVLVMPHGEVPAAAKYIRHFREEGRTHWSGLAIRLGESSELVLYNDSHAMTRVRATLMEEFFHLRLQHARSVVRLLSMHDRGRTYDGAIEQIAYGSGAAALAPYSALKTMLRGGSDVSAIARQFSVSDDLVQYRLKVTKLYRIPRSRSVRTRS